MYLESHLWSLFLVDLEHLLVLFVAYLHLTRWSVFHLELLVHRHLPHPRTRRHTHYHTRFHSFYQTLLVLELEQFQPRKNT